MVLNDGYVCSEDRDIINKTKKALYKYLRTL